MLNRGVPFVRQHLSFFFARGGDERDARAGRREGRGAHPRRREGRRRRDRRGSHHGGKRRARLSAGRRLE